MIERLARKQATYEVLRTLLTALVAAVVIGSLVLTLLQSQKNGAIAANTASTARAVKAQQDAMATNAVREQSDLNAHDRAVTVRLQQLADLIGSLAKPPRTIVVAGSVPRSSSPAARPASPTPKPKASAKPHGKPTPKPSPTCAHAHIGPICA